MPITNFSRETHELTITEKALANIVVDVLQGTSYEKQKCNAAILAEVHFKSKFNVNLTSSRLRAIIHYLRTEKHIPILATGKGYYISYDPERIAVQVKSLDERIRSIQQVRDALHQIQKENESH